MALARAFQILYELQKSFFLFQSGCCEVITEEAAAALRKATKWAQSGLIVSVGPPVETVSPESTSGLSTGDKKKTAQISICRERNSELARYRISAGVQNTLM